MRNVVCWLTRVQHKAWCTLYGRTLVSNDDRASKRSGGLHHGWAWRNSGALSRVSVAVSANDLTLYQVFGYHATPPGGWTFEIDGRAWPDVVSVHIMGPGSAVRVCSVTRLGRPYKTRSL